MSVAYPSGYEGLIYSGRVTNVPGANQFTIPTLAGLGAGKFADTTAPYRAFVLRDAGGAGLAPQGEMQTITAYDSATGTFTAPGFGGGGVAAGDEVMIIPARLAEIAAIKTQTDKLAGAALVAGASASTNWNTGTGTSGEAGADLVTIGGAGVKQKLVKLLINVANVTTGSVVEVRAYDQANSVIGKRLAYSTVRQTPAQGTNPDIIDIVAQTGGPIELDNAMRIELYSSANEAKVINYEYRLELR